MAQQNQQGMNGQGSQFEEKDILQLALNECKHSAMAINQYILEASDDALRRDYMTALGDVYSQQKQVYDVMEQKGWYTAKNASAQEINQAKNKFSQQQGQQQGQQGMQ